MHEQLRRIKHLQNEENLSRDHRAETAKRSRHQKPITPTPQSESMHNLGDSKGNLSQVTYADGGQNNYAYDVEYNIISVTDAQGKVIELHTYDISGRGL